MNHDYSSKPIPNPNSSPTTPAEVLAAQTLTDRPLATRGERFLGALIDGVIGAPVAIALGFGFALVAIGFGIDLESSEGELLTTIVGFFLDVGAFIALQGYLLATRGQTIGKLVMKTQIVSNDDQLLPLSRLLLLRYLPLWIAVSIPGMGKLFAIANALAIFRENHKCLHDDLAGTKVVKLNGAPVPQSTYPTYEPYRW